MKFLIVLLAVSLTGCAQMQREEQERQAYIKYLDTVLAKSRDQREAIHDPRAVIPCRGCYSPHRYYAR